MNVDAGQVNLHAGCFAAEMNGYALFLRLPLPRQALQMEGNMLRLGVSGKAPVL